MREWLAIGLLIRHRDRYVRTCEVRKPRSWSNSLLGGSRYGVASASGFSCEAPSIVSLRRQPWRYDWPEQHSSSCGRVPCRSGSLFVHLGLWDAGRVARCHRGKGKRTPRRPRHSNPHAQFVEYARRCELGGAQDGFEHGNEDVQPGADI